MRFRSAILWGIGVALSIGVLLWLKLGTPSSSRGPSASSAGSLSSQTNGAASSELTTPAMSRGEQWARIHCQVCHPFPQPADLDRKSWQEFVLKKMAFYTGVLQLDPDRNEEGHLYVASGVFPSKPMMSKETWAEIEKYYLENAPERSLPQDPKEPVAVGLKHFELVPPRFRRDPPLTTMVVVDAAEERIYSADATSQALDILDSQGKLLGSIPLGNIPVAMADTERGFYLACIGHFFPREERRGQLILLERVADGFQRKVLMSELPRPCHIEVTDLNGDGKPDLVLSMFGYLTGRLSWLEEKGRDEYAEHILLNKAGAVGTVTRDFNGDGAPDIAALFGQEIESLMIFYNDRKGGFVSRELFKKPPSFGHAWFEIADFNGDGRPDFLVTNGDNADFEPTPKKYHGVRIYLNEGNDRVKEVFFYPLYGAFKAIARDFDQDGDLDIAAISFFPDYATAPQEGFVYLENIGGLKFKPSTFADSTIGRWVTMDAGDVDGDGDLDLVLGSLVRMPTHVPAKFKDYWEKSGPSLVILKNTLR